MYCTKRTTFSICNKYFSYLSPDNKLLVWETSSNSKLVDYIVDSSIYGTCTSLHWISLQQSHSSHKKAKLYKSHPTEVQLIVIGTSKGDILLYNVSTKALYSHLASRHSDSINDICNCPQTDAFVTCSNDQSIAVWDVSTGQKKTKWQTDETVLTMCPLDGNNLLTASTSILWWNIAKKSVVKKFVGSSNEIFNLMPVNVDSSVTSGYFLASSQNDSRVCAWSLTSNKAPVASFVTSDQPADMSISKVLSKEKPLLLAVITRKGNLNLFEHTLNGNVNEPLNPKTNIQIVQEPKSRKSQTDASIMSIKVSDDSESCTVAYGTSEDTLVFKHIKIKKMHKESIDECLSSHSNDSSEKTSSIRKGERSLSLNGLQMTDKSPKSAKHSVKSNLKKKSLPNENSSHEDKVPPHRKLLGRSISSAKSHRYSIEESDADDPKSLANMLLKGISTQNEHIIDNVLHITDSKLLCSCVQNLPTHTLKHVLEELCKRLKQRKKSTSTVGKWLKEIFRIHLKYLIQSKESLDVLDTLKELIEAKKVQDTVSKLSALKGLLSLQTQIASSDESDSESEASSTD